MRPTFVFVDAGNWQNTIIDFTVESGPPFFPTRGYGIGQRREGSYKRTTGSKVIWTKEGYSFIEFEDGRSYLEVKVDYWKSWVHARLHTPTDQPGAMTLYESNDHLSFAKHLTAEKQVEEFVPREGTVTRWEAVSRINHYFDSTVLACVAGYEAGVRLIAASPAEEPLDALGPDVLEERPAWLLKPWNK